MTMREEDVAEGVEIQPLDVRVVEREAKVAPEWGSWLTFTTAAANPTGPQPILKQDRWRSKARILVYAGTGAAATAFVLVGSQRQVANGQGAQLMAGTNVEYNAAQEVYLNGDGTNAMIVVVLSERYA